MRICGLDIATTTGWAIAEGNRYQTGKWHPGKVASEAERNARFRSWLWTFLRANEIEFAAIEDRIKGEMTKTETDAFGRRVKKSVSNDHAKATAAYLIGCAQEVCHSLSIPFLLVPVQTWRAAFNGGQKPGEGEDKKAVTVRVCKMMGIEVSSKDAADAAGIAFWAQVHLNQKRLQAPAGPLFTGAV